MYFIFFFYRELAFFFPDFAVPRVIRSRPQTEERPPSRLQRTLALIRPDTDAESIGISFNTL